MTIKKPAFVLVFYCPKQKQPLFTPFPKYPKFLKHRVKPNQTQLFLHINPINRPLRTLK